MKPSEVHLKQLADEFSQYADLVKHPGWRALVEKPLQQEIEWTEQTMRNMMDGIETDPRIKWESIKQYRRSLQFVQNQVLLRIKMGMDAFGTLAARAEQLGLKDKEEVKIPSFTEVKT